MQASSKASASNGDSRIVGNRKTKRVLNLPLVLGTLIAAAVLGPAAYAWRSYQVGRTASAFLERADHLEEEENWREAAAYLRRYLQLRSDDEDIADIWIRLAETFDKSAETRSGKKQAVAYYYRALGARRTDEERLPGDEQQERSLRCRLAALQLEVGWFASAEKEAQKVVDAAPDGPEGHRLLALALFGQAETGAVLSLPKGADSVAAVFKKALKLQPERDDPAYKAHEEEIRKANVELSSILATVYRERPELLSQDERSLPAGERAKLADDVMNALVAADPENVKALLARYRYRADPEHELLGAKDDLDAALKIAPDDAAVLMAAAGYFQGVAEDQGSADKGRKNYEKACGYYERVIEVAPSTEVAYLGLGDIHRRQNEPDKALAAWQLGLKQCGKESINLNMRMAEVLISQGRLVEQADEDKDKQPSAEEHLDMLDRVLPNRVAFLPRSVRMQVEASRDLLRGKWLVAKREYVEAIPVLTRVTASQTSTLSEVQTAFTAELLLGYTYGQLGLWDKAAPEYENAARLRPKTIEPRLGAAAAWAQAGLPDRAIPHYQQALTIQDNPRIWLSLAQALFHRELRLPKEDRKWQPCKQALAEAGKDQPGQPLADAWRLKLLEADYLMVSASEAGGSEKSKGEARELLRGAEGEYPQSKDLLQRLVLGYERLGFPADADRALGSLAQLADGSAAAYLLRSRLYSARKQYEEAREALRTGLKELDEKEQAGARLAHQLGLIQVSLDQGDLEGARQQLLQLHKRDPSNVGIVRRLAELAFQTQNLSEADGLAHWENKLRQLEGPDGSHWKLHRAQRLLIQAKTATEPGLLEAEQLQSQLQSLRPAWPDAYTLRALISLRRGQYEEAIDAYRTAIRMGEQRVSVYQQLASLLHQTGRYQEADRYLSLLYDRSPSLVSSSPVLSPLTVSVAARLGETDRAVEAARRGVEGRPNDPAALIQLGQSLLLSAQKHENGKEPDDKEGQRQLKEAEAVFQQAVELAPKDGRTHAALFNFYVRSSQPDRAEETLQRIAQMSDLSDAQRDLVLVQGNAALFGFYLRSDQPDRARETLEQLVQDVDLSDSQRDLVTVQVNALFEFYLRSSQPDRAREALEKLVEKAYFSDAQRGFRDFLLARGHELLGDVESAKEEFEALEKTKDVAIQRRLALFHSQQNRSREAEKAWRKILTLEPKSQAAQAARRALAVILAARGGKEEWEEVERLLAASGQDVSRLDVRLHAAVLMRRGGQDNLRKAGQLLEKAVADAKEPDPVDRRLLAQLCEAEGRLQAARHQLVALVGRANASADDLAAYVDFLIRQVQREDGGPKDADLREAATWLARLEKLAPDTLRTVSLQASLLHAQGRTDEIEAKVEESAARLAKQVEEDQAGQARLALGVGNLYLAVEKHEAAERWYRGLLELEPAAYQPLVASLARQGRVQEAIEVCVDASKSDPSPQPIIVLVSALTSNRTTPEDFRAADPIITQALADHAENADLLQRAALLMSVANLRIVQGRPDRAAELYRQVRQLTSGNDPALIRLRRTRVSALNNLACLLGEEDDPDEKEEARQEALKYIEEAIQIAGPQAALLDTKGTILVYSEEVEKAIQCLEEACSNPDADPRFRFHLAVAYDRNGQGDKAREAFDRARQGGLAEQILTEKDEELLKELEKKHPQQGL